MNEKNNDYILKLAELISSQITYKNTSSINHFPLKNYFKKDFLIDIIFKL